MKIAFYCESPADQAGMAVFAEGILGAPPEPINMDLEAHSVPAFFTTLDGVFRGIHYNCDAEALVIVVDSDRTEMHDDAHDAATEPLENCRLCQTRNIIRRARRQLKARQGRGELKVAIGLAVPAIEAWYLVGKNHQVGEAAWRAGVESGRPPFTTHQLKTDLYGTNRPALARAIECGVSEARRVIQDIAAIEAGFPVGFGLMAKVMRSWIA